MEKIETNGEKLVEINDKMSKKLSLNLQKT